MANKENVSKQVKIGVVFIIALAILYFGINFLKGINIFKATNSFIVTFDNVEGMVISDPVTIHGLKIGMVNKMTYDPDHPDKIFVKIQMDKGVEIPIGSTISMEEGLLGGSTVQLEASNNKEYYRVGDTIAGIKKSGVMSMVTELGPKVGDILPKVDSILTHLDILLTSTALSNTFENLDGLTVELKKTTVRTNQILGQLNKDLPELTGNLNKTMSNVSGLTSKLNKLDLESTFKKIDHTLNNVNLITNKLNEKDNTIGLLLNDRQLYDQINSTLGSTNELLKNVKENPSKYVNIKVF